MYHQYWVTTPGTSETFLLEKIASTFSEEQHATPCAPWFKDKTDAGETFPATLTQQQWICLMLLRGISRLLQLDWLDLQPNENYDTAEGENKLHPFRKCRLCIVSPADWPHSRSSEKKRPVGQTASFQPNTYLSRHIHLAAVQLLQLPPFSPEGDKAAPFVARWALGPFGWADRAIYINIHKHIVATRYEPQLKAVLTSPWPSHTTVTLVCHPAFKNTQAPRWEHSVCGRLQRGQFWVLTSWLVVLGETLQRWTNCSI